MPVEESREEEFNVDIMFGGKISKLSLHHLWPQDVCVNVTGEERGRRNQTRVS